MAHVKVVRRSMRPEEWTDLRFGWLERGLILDREEIEDLQIRGKVGSSVIEMLRTHGALQGMSETNQISMF